jgi:hypothetical protein
MRKMIVAALALFLGMISLQGKIIEIPRFQEISKHVTAESIVLLDMDDTVLIPAQMLGSDAWFCARLKKHQIDGMDSMAALEKALAEWESVRHATKMKLVEKEISSVIQDLQKKYKIMGLTAQGLALATRTVQQLQENDIDLSKTAPNPGDYFVTVKGHGTLFRKGILFTSGMNKGEAFFKFCDTIGFKPKRIVAMDDKASHLVTIETEAQKRGIEFVGLRYAYSDIHKAAYRHEVAEFQFTHSSFAQLLSDEEAMAKMKAISHR